MLLPALPTQFCECVYIFELEVGLLGQRVHSFNRHLMSEVCVPSTVLGAGETSENKTDKCPCPRGAYILVVEEGVQF